MQNKTLAEMQQARLEFLLNYPHTTLYQLMEAERHIADLLAELSSHNLVDPDYVDASMGVIRNARTFLTRELSRDRSTESGESRT